MNDRYTIVLQFFLGDNDEGECSYQMSDASGLPQVGQKVSLYGTKDGNGNYVYEREKLYFEGIVTRIEHTYEQRGMDSQSWAMLHFIHVFLKPEED